MVPSDSKAKTVRIKPKPNRSQPSPPTPLPAKGQLGKNLDGDPPEFPHASQLIAKALDNHVQVGRLRLLCLTWHRFWTMSGMVNETGFGRTKFKYEVVRTEDLIAGLMPALQDAITFQRNSRAAILRTTRKWCLLHVQSLEQTASEAEMALGPRTTHPRHLKG